MKYNILGFYQPRAVELGLDSNDLLVLRWFVDYAGTNKMRTILMDNRMYYWVNYAIVLEELPILKISKQTLAKKHFGNLVKANVLEHKFVKEGGSFSYYCYGINYDTLVYLQTDGGCVKNNEGMSKFTEGCVKTDIGGMSKFTNQINNIQDINNTQNINNNKESISNDIQKKTANLDDLLTLPDKSVNVDSPLKENTSQDEVKEIATDNLDTTDNYNPILFLQKSEGLETPHSTQSPSLAPCGKSGEVLDIVSYWKSKEVLSQPRGDVNKWLSGKIRNVKRCNAIEKAIKEYGIENVKTAINRYSIILADDDYYFDTSWGLDIFCKQSNALPDFLDGGSKWESYKKKKGKQIDMFVYPTAKSIEDILDGTHGRESTQQDMSGAVLDSLTEKSVLKSQRRHI